jgi:hypothetical protein
LQPNRPCEANVIERQHGLPALENAAHNISTRHAVFSRDTAPAGCELCWLPAPGRRRAVRLTAEQAKGAACGAA